MTMPQEPGEERRTDLTAAVVDLRLTVERMSGDMKVAMSELQRDVDSRLGSLERRLDAEMSGVRQIAASSTGTLGDLAERQREMGKRIGAIEDTASRSEDRLNEQQAQLRLIAGVIRWLGLPGAVAIITALYYLAQGGPT